ncbi:MAG TPA: type IV pilus assembly protein PilM [Candidatus Paceibacterota bacterium]|nr:type IV pilus assembly protein PilM [Candidatus Paceibacterota bacterium]
MSNPLDGLLAGLLKKKSDSVVGLDIGGSFVKAVQLHKKGAKAVLDTYGEVALGPLSGLEIGQATNLSTEKLATAILDLFNEAKITSRDVVFSLPLTSTLLVVIELPDLGEDKLKEMIPIEARKYIPTSVSEVALDFWIVPRAPQTYVDPDEEERAKAAGPKVDVLIAAVHKDVLNRYQQIAQKIGATNVSMEIEIFSTIRSVMGRDSSLTMILDMGAANTKIAMVEDGIVRSSHLINSGSQDITLALSKAKGVSMLKAEEIKRDFGLAGDPTDPSIAEITRLAVERIFAEANRLLTKYQQTKHVSVSRVVLTGGGVLLKGLPDLVQSSFSTTVVFGNPFEKVEAPAVLAPILKEAGPEFAVALGLAIRKL